MSHLLIVPRGIEIDLPEMTEARDLLLIVPRGIEINKCAWLMKSVNAFNRTKRY